MSLNVDAATNRFDVEIAENEAKAKVESARFKALAKALESREVAADVLLRNAILKELGVDLNR